jgi:ribosomal protein L27
MRFLSRVVEKLLSRAQEDELSRELKEMRKLSSAAVRAQNLLLKGRGKRAHSGWRAAAEEEESVFPEEL